MARRRKRNKKKDTAQGIVMASPLVAILLVSAALALVYLWMCGRCEAMGKDITVLEKQKVQVNRRVLNEQYKLSNMKSPKNMERLLAGHGLSMVWPDERSIVRIRTRPAEPEQLAVAGVRRQYALRAGTTMND